MQRLRISIIASFKGGRFVSEMLPDQTYLVFVFRILNHDALDAARVCHPENVRRSREIEGHDGLPHLVNVLLLGLS